MSLGWNEGKTIGLGWGASGGRRIGSERGREGRRAESEKSLSDVASMCEPLQSIPQPR